MNVQTQDIGKALKQAREKMGYSRNALVNTRALKGVITGEGLRKIEYNERVPRFPTLRKLADVLGIDKKHLSRLEETAFEKQMERVAKRANREKVTVRVGGKIVRTLHTPHDKKLEAKVRTAIDEMAQVVNMYGVMDEDVAHFRKHARSIVLKHFSA